MLKSSLIREVTLYRYRYIISYGFFAVLLLGLLLLGINTVPRGLTDGEMHSAVSSVTINIFQPQAQNVIDAPYHLLQKLSIQFFGLSPFAVKLPSIALGVITGLALLVMLQRWFRRNVAVITATIISTSAGFLSMSRLGEPLIMPTFWTVILLLASTFFLHSNKVSFFWKAVCFIGLAMLLYSPLGIYPLAAMFIAGVLHPHVRWRVSQGKWWHFVLIGLAFVVTVTPLAIGLAKEPSLSLNLLGLSDLHFTIGRFIDAAHRVISSLFNFTNSQVGPITTPLFSSVAIILMLFGFLKLCTARYSARSYMLFIWLGLLLPVLLLNPTMLFIVLVPGALIMAIGIETLIREWYGLFPRNPYARIGALVPLSILIISTVAIDVQRYYYGNHYALTTSQAFHTELPAVQKALLRSDINQNNVQLVAPENQIAFYDILRREHKKLVVTTAPKNVSSKGTLLVIATAPPQPTKAAPYRIITDDLKGNAVLLRIYTRW